MKIEILPIPEKRDLYRIVGWRVFTDNGTPTAFPFYLEFRATKETLYPILSSLDSPPPYHPRVLLQLDETRESNDVWGVWFVAREIDPISTNYADTLPNPKESFLWHLLFDEAEKHRIDFNDEASNHDDFDDSDPFADS